MRPAIVSSRCTHDGFEHRLTPSPVVLTSGFLATPESSIARCFARASASSLAARAFVSAAVSPAPPNIPFAIARSVAVAPLDLGPTSTGPSRTGTILAKASSDVAGAPP